MADSKLIDYLQTMTKKPREECEKALAAANGVCDEALEKLGGPAFGMLPDSGGAATRPGYVPVLSEVFGKN